MSFEGNTFKNSWFRISCNLKFNLYPPFIVPRVHKGCKVSGKYFFAWEFAFFFFDIFMWFQVKCKREVLPYSKRCIWMASSWFSFSPWYPHSLHIQLHQKWVSSEMKPLSSKDNKTEKCDPTHFNRISLINTASHPIHLHILLGFWAIVALKKDSKPTKKVDIPPQKNE